jgi:hypothetical protein
MYENIDELFESTSIYKTLLITVDDDDCWNIATHLEARDHMTGVVTLDHVDDERPLYLNKLRMFENGIIRILCISMSAWYKITSDLESFAMHHNLLILYGLDCEQRRMCLDWIQDAHDRGLKTHKGVYYIVYQDPDENFLMNKVE